MTIVHSLFRPLSPIVALVVCAACSSASVSDRAAKPTDDESATANAQESSQRARLVRVTVDNSQDYKANEVYQLQYDASGLTVGELIDDNADDNFDHVFAYIYSENRLVKSLYDADDDGSVDVTRRFSYDANGMLQRLLVEPSDPSATARRVNYELDDSGRLATSRLDVNDDGFTDTVTTFRYDDQGRVITMEMDEGGDEVINAIRRFEYDAAGRMTRSTLDKGADGSIEQTQRFTYEIDHCQLAGNHQPFLHTCVILP